MGLDSALSRDADFQELERQELVTGEPRYIEDEIRNTTIAAILGAVAAVLSLIAMIMMWFLYYRHRNDSFLTHGIVMIFVFLFAAGCAVWALGASSALKAGRQPNSLFTLIIFLVSLTAMGYCLVMSMWLIYYRSIHYDYIIGVFAAGKDGERFHSGWGFDDVWKQNRRMLYWIVIFTLISGICFALIAYTAASAVWNKYQLVRFGLYYALAWMTLAAWLCLYWIPEAYDRAGFVQNDDAVFAVKGLKVLAIVALVVAFLNMIVNLIKTKVGYFIFGLITAGLFIILVCFAAPLWRQVRREQLQEVNDGANVSCQITQYSVHESDLDSWCGYFGGKYQPSGTTCGKENLVTRWENSDNPAEVRSLNPGCCLYAKHANVWPFMMLALWALVLLIATGIAMVCNFYLADTTEYLTNANKSLGIGDYLAIFVILALSIGWGIYFIARKSKNTNQIYTRSSYINSYNDPKLNTVDGWTQVPSAILAQSNPGRIDQPSTAAVCYPYDTATLPVPAFQTAGAACADSATCTIRVALALFDGAKFQVGNIGTANRAFGDNRFVFFPQCAVGMSDFIMFSGNQDQIKTALSNIQVCPASVVSQPNIQVYSDQVKANTLNNAGLVTGEVSTNAAANMNTAACSTGFTTASCATTPSCKYRAPLTSQLVARTLKGRFYYIANGQKRYDVPNTVGFTANDASGSIGTLPQLFNDGVFSISGLPLYKAAPYKLRLAITDSSNTFLPSFQDIIVDSKYGTDQISAGEIRLNTRDGSVCLPFTNATCIAAQQTSRGSITTIVQDGGAAVASSNNARLTAATVNLYQYHVMNGNVLAAGNTDTNGVVSFTNLPYHAYTLIATKTGYNPNPQYVDLQSPTLSPKPFTLIPTVTDYDTKVVAEMVTPATDFDLLLQMRNVDGKECEVSPYSKYCPYTYHTNDVTTGPGEESIVVKKLSVATYNAFVRQAPPYDAACKTPGFIKENAYHLAAPINWNHLQGSAQVKIAPAMINALTLFGGSTVSKNFEELVFASFTPAPVVETDDQAKAIKTVIRANGTALATGSQYTSTSYFISSDKGTTVSEAHTPVAPILTFVTCPSPPAGATNCLKGTGSAVNIPATLNSVVTNYTLTSGTIQTNVSEQSNITTHSNNATIFNYTRLIKNSKDSSNNNTVNDTFSNRTSTTPNGSNASHITTNVLTFKADANTSTHNRTVNDQFINGTNVSSSNISEGTNVTTATAVLGNTTKVNLTGANTSNSGIYYNITYSNQSATSVFNSTGAAATAVISSNTSSTAANISFSKDYVATDGTFSWCNVSTTNETQGIFNGSLLVKLVNDTKCNFTNGTIVRKLNSTFTETPKTGAVLTNSNITHTYTHPNGTTTDFKLAPAARRILADFGHAQGGAASGSFLWISCFTGFGSSSTININTLQDASPTVADCIKRLTADRPNLVVEKLNDLVKNFKA